MKRSDWLLDLLFPPKCPYCQGLLEGSYVPACSDCQPQLPWLMGEQARRAVDFTAGCLSPLAYRGKVVDSIHRFKFSGRASYARPYGILVGQCVRDMWKEPLDGVTWTPLSRQRRRERGYDQARLLAERACALWDTAPVRLLDKTVHNPAQSGLKEGSARRDNVRGVYRAADPDGTRGRRILLVDDICTTGATLAECARVLREAGAADVVCAAAALTPLRAEKAAPDAKKG